MSLRQVGMKKQKIIVSSAHLPIETRANNFEGECLCSLQELLLLFNKRILD